MALTTIHVDDIAEEGKNVSCEVQPQDLELTEHDVQIRGGLALDADLVRNANGVRVTGFLEALYVRQCVRCLVEYTEAVQLPLDAEYRRKPNQGTPLKGNGRASRPEDVLGLEEQDEMDVEDEDIYLFSGKQVELAPMLREQVILSIPMQPLCHTECQGLCPMCGQDRNERRCVCPEEPQLTPFAALKAYVGRTTDTPSD